jgi:hypothetical protein
VKIVHRAKAEAIKTNKKRITLSNVITHLPPTHPKLEATVPEHKIYVSESLTKLQSNLFFLAREFRTKFTVENPDAPWKFAWTKNGKVFIRQNDLESTATTQILTEKDIPGIH